MKSYLITSKGVYQVVTDFGAEANPKLGTMTVKLEVIKLENLKSSKK